MLVGECEVAEAEFACLLMFLVMEVCMVAWAVGEVVLVAGKMVTAAAHHHHLHLPLSGHV